MFGSIITSGEPDAKFFSLQEYKPTREIDPVNFLKTDLSILTTQLQNGDLLRVFNSITSGQTLVKIEVDLEIEKGNGFQDFQVNVDRGLWASLFALRLPARLTTTDGKSFEGNLDPFYETGMEQTAWCLYDFHHDGYGSLHHLKKGDLLEVFSHVTEGNIEWQGRLNFNSEEFRTGKTITLISYDESKKDDHAAFSESMVMTPVDEVYTKTLIHPPLDVMDKFSLHHMPVQVIR